VSLGTALGAACYSTQAEAAGVACASVLGVSGAGAVSCAGVTSSPSTSVGGGVTLDYLLRVDAGGSFVDHAAQMLLQGCETYDLSYWQPYIGAWVAALVSILCARIVYRRIFADREGF